MHAQQPFCRQTQPQCRTVQSLVSTALHRCDCVHLRGLSRRQWRSSSVHPHQRLAHMPRAQSQGFMQPDGSYSADKTALSDGPDLFMMRSTNNLGAMQDSIKGQPSDADIKAMQGVPNRGTAFEGLYVDGSAILGSSVLLSILLFLSLERILGLDQWFAKTKRRWKEKQEDKEKWAVYNARQRLEESFSNPDSRPNDKQ